jgi:predicted  nucleic acid-binding Zn-ribbon protein
MTSPPTAPTIPEQLVTLAELANIDAKNRAIADRLEHLPVPARTADDAVAALKNEVNTVTTKKEAAEKAKKLLEHEVQDERIKIKKWEARAHELKGEREHAALLSEVHTAKRMIGRHEDAQLEHMEVIEEASAALKALDGKMKAAVEGAKLEWSKVEGDMKALRADAAALDVTRQALLTRLPTAVVKRYEQVAAKRMGTGVALITGEVCSQCKRTLPPQLCIQVRKGAVLEQCPSCSRFLVHEEMTRAPAPQAGETEGQAKVAS